jgi:hypothetical protein
MLPKPQPLHTELPNSLKASAEICSAYSEILKLEQDAHSDANPKICEEKLVYARVLGYLIQEGPSMDASEHVAKEVNDCQDHDQFYRLGEMYLYHYICICELQLLPCFSTLMPF